jgi:hypothetical protein
MKIIFTLLLLIFPCCLKSQIWIKPNAVWHYNYLEPSSFSSFGFLKVEYLKDTLINAKNCQMLVTSKYQFVNDQFDVTHFMSSSVLDTNYTWNNSDTVFYWKNNQFEIMYDFTKATNDSWIISSTNNFANTCSEVSTTKVTNEGIVNFDNVDYKYSTIYSHDSCNIKIRGKINSRFGNFNSFYEQYSFLFPVDSWWCSDLGLDETYLIQFQCFQDDSLFYNPSGEDCEYMLNHVGLIDLKLTNFSIYPNPIENEFNIISLFELKSIKIYNLEGKCLFQKLLYGFQDQINLNLTSGVYLIEVNNINFHKIIKKIEVK